MNWPRIILDGLAMSLLFNAVAGLGFLLVPQAYSTMFPKEIRQAAAPFVEKKDVRTMKLILYPLYLVLLVYWAISAHFAGMTGFWNLFWADYAEMTMVSLSDFIILDCWLPPKAKPFIKGAERCKAWTRWEWLKTLAIPEHGLLWTLIVCYLGFLIFGVSLFVPVVSGWTPLPRWACVFNILPLMLVLMPTRVGGSANWAGAIMFLGLMFLL